MRRRVAARSLFCGPALAIIAACGGRDAPPPVAAEDETLLRIADAANAALQLDQPQSAAELYARALARARERDDPVMIGDMAFGQATAALAHGDAPGALAVAREVRAELARRGRAAPPALLLAKATALHRLGRVSEAEAMAAGVAGRGAEDDAAALRAVFLLGLIAAGRGDLARLRTARAALGTPRDAAWQADAAELEAHVAMLAGQPPAAAARAAAAAVLRQEAVDYRGLSRARALQGRAVARQGDAATAADLLLRAGRGAAERGETADAHAWLTEARDLALLAGAAAVATAARALLQGLPPVR